MMTAHGDLGFTCKTRSNGSIDIFHQGRKATTLRGAVAAEFLEDAAAMSDEGLQQVMARLTGNYKHGNERMASKHPRRRRQAE